MEKRLKVGTKWILGVTGGSRFRLTSFQDVNNRRPRHLKASKKIFQKIFQHCLHPRNLTESPLKPTY